MTVDNGARVIGYITGDAMFWCRSGYDGRDVSDERTASLRRRSNSTS